MQIQWQSWFHHISDENICRWAPKNKTKTWSTKASNFRAKKILKNVLWIYGGCVAVLGNHFIIVLFGIVLDILCLRSTFATFLDILKRFRMLETNFWDDFSRFCIFGRVSERMTCGEQPHQSIVLQKVHLHIGQHSKQRRCVSMSLIYKAYFMVNLFFHLHWW